MKPGWRIPVLGLVFLALFSVLTLRLWFLQVARGETASVEVAQQQIAVVDTPAPRGEIRDRNGALLAGTRAASSVVVDRSLLSAEREADVVQRLAALLDLAEVEVSSRLDDGGPTERVRVVDEVSAADALFIREHAEEFPGVTIEDIPVRTYPEGTTAAHVIGYIGRPDALDLERSSVGSDDVVGKFGIEKEYDELLRGRPGKVKFRVDAERTVLSVIGGEDAVPGGTALLTVDLDVQDVLERALTAGIDLARDGGDPARRAAGVVLDITDGAVVAMASVPTYDPSDFVGGLTAAEWEDRTEAGAFNNFAIQGVYPPASTFKTVAYVMALENEIFPADVTDYSHDGTFFCNGQITFDLEDGSQNTFDDWKPEGHGLVDLHGALHQSCDLYFWSIALEVWGNSGARGDRYDEAEIQDVAREFGFGAVTGIDLPFEQQGLIPDREWFERTQRESPGLVRTNTPWVGGDVMNIVIGQGSVTSTPLQLAAAYGAMINGGTLWQPRVVNEVLGPDGESVFVNPPRALNEIDLNPSTVAFLKEDLRQVVNGTNGTARVPFESLDPVLRSQIGGKTGTAEIDKAQQLDTAWFVGVAPIDDPKYVVAVVIDLGGSGGGVAAPTARPVLEFLLTQTQPDEVRLVAGEDTD